MLFHLVVQTFIGLTDAQVDLASIINKFTQLHNTLGSIIGLFGLVC